MLWNKLVEWSFSKTAAVRFLTCSLLWNLGPWQEHRWTRQEASGPPLFPTVIKGCGYTSYPQHSGPSPVRGFTMPSGSLTSRRVRSPRAAPSSETPPVIAAAPLDTLYQTRINNLCFILIVVSPQRAFDTHTELKMRSRAFCLVDLGACMIHREPLINSPEGVKSHICNVVRLTAIVTFISKVGSA